MKKITLIFLFISIIFSFAFARNDNNINLKIGGISLFDDLHDHLTAKQIREKNKGNENYYAHLKKPFQFPTVTVENHALIRKENLLYIVFQQEIFILTSIYVFKI